LQLQFTRDELKLLAEVLEVPNSVRDDRRAVERYNLLDHVIANDMRLASDELEDLLDILTDYEQDRRQQLAQTTETRAAEAESKNLKLLRHILEKVTEACAMV
jgi:hypothetical protein